MKSKIVKSTITALGLTLTLALGGITTKAAEFSVTEVSAILYTNEATQLLSDADDATVVVPTVEAGLPVSVTGVTSNGYWRIDIGGTTWYVSGAGLSATSDTNTTATADTTVTSSTGWTQESVYNALMNLKTTKYPTGTPWGDEKKETITQYSNGGSGSTFTSNDSGGCAFANRVMKDVFGEDVVLARHLTYDISPIKIGDIIQYGSQYYVVTGIDGTYVYAVEGNYNGTVYWGKKIAISDLFTGYYADIDDNIVGQYSRAISYYTAY